MNEPKAEFKLVLPRALRQRFKVFVTKKGTTMTDFIIKMIEEALERDK